MSRKLRDQKRKSSGERGYDRRWQLHRESFLAEFPFCICCATHPAVVIDHIIPVRQDDSVLSGSSDPLFWEVWNHQPVCKRHHRIKTDMHDDRLSSSRRWILNQLIAEDADARRQELIVLTEIWPQWVNLSTGEICSLHE